MNINIRNTGVLNFLRGTHNKERCGLVFGDIENGEMRIIRLIECPNAASNPRAHFYITKRNVEKAISQTKLRPLGYFHTHGGDHNPEPSQHDIEEMRKYPRLIGMVYHPSSGEVIYFNHLGIQKREVIY